MTKELFIRVTPDDCDRETFRSGGHGGQNQNKVSSGVRWRHRASGAVGESRESRSQEQNARIAWKRMAQTPVFRAWIDDQRRQADAKDREKAEQTLIARRVGEMLCPENLLIEIKENGEWVTE